MPLAAALGLPRAAVQSRSAIRTFVTARVQRAPPACTSTGFPRRRAGLARFAATGGASAAGADLEWQHVARDVKSKLGKAFDGKEDKLQHLQSWLNQAKLTHTGDSDAEKDQAELCVEEEADHMGLDQMNVDVKGWLSRAAPSEGDTDIKMAGVVVVRLLQEYHQQAGVAFDDEDEDCYWRLQGFVPGELVDALDHELLKRMIKAYISMPFSNV